MARKTSKTSRQSASGSGDGRKPAAAAKRSAKSASRSKQTPSAADKVVDTALALAAEQAWDDVRLNDIAARSGMSLSELRAQFDGKLEILAAFSRRIDRAVLDGLDPDLEGEPPAERLFDVLMSRFDALLPHREAVASIARSFQKRPGELIAWNPVAVRSMTWMLEAAGLDTGGRLGRIGAQGLAIVFARTLRVWLRDDDPGMARTMVELDRRLAEGGRWMRRLESLASLADAVGRARRGRRGRRSGREATEGKDEGSGI